MGSVNIIDVLGVIDGETILKLHPGASTDPNRPTGLTPQQLRDNVRLITRVGDLMSDQATDRLNIRADLDDIIRWRAFSLTADTDLDVEFYQFMHANGNKNIIPDIRQSSRGYWQGTVEDTGVINYYWRFKVLDRKGNIKGCFYWDPAITVQG